jgi:transmembrane sensor
MESPEQIWQLMAKVLNSEASPMEREELFTLISTNHTLQQQFELLNRVWEEKENNIKDEEDARKHIVRIIRRAETEPSDQELILTHRRRRRRFIAIASSTLIILLTSGWLFFIRPLAGSDKDVLVAKNGSRTRSLLPDGTTVWLNAGSKLFIQNDFSGPTREVRLEGEAFFDVAKNAQRPFIVHASGIDIKVVGTAFNVKAYPQDKTVETTLLRGLVQVFDRQYPARKPIELKPNEKLVLGSKAASYSAEVSESNKPAVIQALPRFTITRIDSTKEENERFETAWVYSRLEFRGDSFEDLALKMQRWYNVSIIFTDEKVKQLSFNGSFEKETVEQAFEALKEANSFTYQINKYEISVGSSQ